MADLNLNVLAGRVLGAVYVLVGVLGFTIVGGVGFAATDGRHLLGIFETNPLHNLVHVAVGAALLLAAGRGARLAAAANTLVGAVYLLVAAAGLFALDSKANLLALNGADNVLHAGSAIALLVIGVAARGSRTSVAQSLG